VNGDVIEGRATLSKTRLLRNRLRIIGQRGALEIAEGQSHSVTFYPPEGRIKHDLSCLGIEDALKDKSVFQLELEDFVGAINAGKQPKVGAEESASMATIFENCYQIATALDEPWVDAAIPRLRAALPAEPTAASQPRS
jgi:predicted dehydrogenase